MLIQVLCDSRSSWMIPHAEKFVNRLKEQGHSVGLIHEHNEVVAGDILILLSCEKIFKALHLNRHNLVVHESDLPLGKGWSPLTWQVLENKDTIPVTLFEAAAGVDSGDIYFQEYIKLDGTELIGELREKQAEATFRVIDKFISQYPDAKPIQQEGQESFYKKRTAADSRLDINKTIAEQINLLRVCDNEKYPAFFEWRGQKYIIKISKQHE